MTTYHELIAKAQELAALAEHERRKEASEALKHVRRLVAQYKLTPRQIFGRMATPTDGRKVYQGPNGEIWVSGRGRRPLWVKNLIDSGDDINKYLVSTT